MDISKEIKKLLIEKDKNIAWLAKELGCSYQNVSQRLIKNNWRAKEAADIFNLLGYEMKIELIDKKES